jgi:hypothetical protein
VDGFNLYHAIDALGVPHLKWLDLWALCRTFLRDGEALESVAYFTAHMVWDAGKLQRHKQYVAALQSRGVEPIISKFLTQRKYCDTGRRNCKVTSEKQTDVAFATRIIGDCLQRNVERVLLITADSDQIPTLAMVRALAPDIQLSMACPPNRMRSARELNDLADDFREITRGRMERCLLPRNVVAGNKVVARCPAKYQHPEREAA